MGSCTTKLQKENTPKTAINTDISKHKKCSYKLKQSQTSPVECNIVNDTKEYRKGSDDSIFSSSFEFEELQQIKQTQPQPQKQPQPPLLAPHNNNTDNDSSPILASSVNIQNEPLINLRFKRTLFCEDITYEYQMSCNLFDSINNEEIVQQWVLRLTVEKITKYYAETLEKWASNKIKSIPFQFGKVMKPKVFTELLDNILKQPSILKEQNTFFSEKTANFLNIPYDIRSIIQYNPDRFIHIKISEMCVEDFKYSDIMFCNDEKYKYLCHSVATYKHDYEYDDCCQCYDEPSITCYSYWVRSLQMKVDLLLNITSNNIFYIVMNDLSYNITQILTNLDDIGININENCAWIIADYLPKYLLFNRADERCNSQIIYKYDPRSDYYDDDEDGYDEEEENGQFLLDVMGNKLLQRHDINVNELHDLCEKLRVQHTSLPPSLPEMSPESSLSEFIVSSMNNQIMVNTHANTTINPTNINLDTPTKEYEMEESILSITDSISGSGSESDNTYRIFFSAFIDEEGEDDINLYQWIQSLQKIPINISEKEIVSAFNFMIKQNEDSEGYIDFVDFTNFCSLNCKQIKDENIKRTQQLLNNFIIRN